MGGPRPCSCLQVNTCGARTSPTPTVCRVVAAPAARARLVPRPWVSASAPQGSWDCRARRLYAMATVMAREAVLEFTMAWARVYMFFSTWRQPMLFLFRKEDFFRGIFGKGETCKTIPRRIRKSYFPGETNGFFFVRKHWPKLTISRWAKLYPR